MIDHQTYDNAIRKPWTDTMKEAGLGVEPIETEPAELEEAKHETESAAVFIAGLVVVILAACLGLWLGHTFGPQ